ncbi:Retrovirus-related Pol polyprotein from transposon 17.6 [Sarcoptes scabiei]|uniref:RNA-directed DNA polymerase n=1 Tax=Sarcoptes scabiei TaxID=52283 RepID=A0A834R6J2_SARSC|nr:Retrovirus-related Pol polyprotein from transposon 17.6 [Sarcoptes scabiei]
MAERKVVEISNRPVLRSDTANSSVESSEYKPFPMSRVYLRPMRKDESILQFIQIFESWIMVNDWNDEDAGKFLHCMIEDSSLKSRMLACSKPRSFKMLKKIEYFDKISRLIEEIYGPNQNQLIRDNILAGLDYKIVSRLMINQKLPDDIADVKSLIEVVLQNMQNNSHNTNDCRSRSKNQNHNQKQATNQSTKCANINLDSGSPRYFVPIKLFGEKTMALFDSGSNKTIAPSSLIKPENRFRKRCGTASTTGYLSIIGSTNVDVNLQNIQFKHHILIADDISHVIFGMDLIDRLKISWNSDRSIDFWHRNKKHNVKLVEEKNDTSTICMSISQILQTLPEDLSFEEKEPSKQNRIDKRVSKLITKFPDIVKGTAVAKKDQSLRLAIDFRQLNKMTIFDAHPSPRIDEILSGLRDAKVFSKIDFKQGYYQIPLRAEDKQKTAFQFKNNLYQFTVMPFGLSTACQTFLRLIEQLFGHLDFVRTYIDDILIFSKSEDDHVRHIEAVFSIIKDASLTINLDKSEFFKSTIEFLGFKIAENEIKMTQDKTKAIRNYPKPTNTKELKRFLGLASYYRKLIDNFATIAYPLYKLMKKKIKFSWGNEEEQSFNLLKQKLSSESIVKIPDFNRSFYVRTDASDAAMAAVLTQRDDKGNPYVIEYFSKSFSDTQKRYPVIEKEATALITAIEKWSYYLKFRKFYIQTDHRPLVFLNSMAAKNSKIARMCLRLQEFNYEIEHLPGNENIDADALSRIKIEEIDFNRIKNLQKNDDR